MSLFLLVRYFGLNGQEQSDKEGPIEYESGTFPEEMDEAGTIEEIIV